MNPDEKKYRYLTKNFFEYNLDQQIISIYRDRDKIEKVEEFIKAMKCGDFKINQILTKQQFRKLSEIGVKIPIEFLPK